jgi:hypothetical protein
MAWDKTGRYYSRSRKVNGRVVREYVGSGRVAELAARLDAIAREKRRSESSALRHEKAELEALEADVQAFSDMTDVLARAALLAAGFHQHRRGDWRKRRDKGSNAPGARTDQG